MNVLVAWETLLKRGGSCGVREQAVASSPSSALQMSPLPMHKCTALRLTTVQLVNRLRLSNKWAVHQQGLCVCLCMWPICWTAILMDFNAYWAALPTGGWHRLLVHVGQYCNVWEAWTGQQ